MQESLSTKQPSTESKGESFRCAQKKNPLAGIYEMRLGGGGASAQSAGKAGNVMENRCNIVILRRRSSTTTGARSKAKALGTFKS